MKSLITISIASFILSTFSYRAAALAFILLVIVYFYEGFKCKFKLYLSRGAIVTVSILNALTLLLSLNSEIYILYYIKMTAMMVYVVLLCSLVSSNIMTKEELIKCFKNVIWLNAFFFLLQFFTFEVTGYLIDFNEFVREGESHTIYNSRSLETFILNIRATGLYSEPSFYAMSVFPLALIISLHEKKFNYTLIVALLTCLLSLSIAAILIALVSLFVFYKELKSSKLLMLFLASILVISIPYLYDFIISRLYENADYDAVGDRMLILNEFIYRSITNDIFGSGYFWDEAKPIGVTGLNGAQIRDSSFYLYTYFSGGVVGVLALFFASILCLPKNWKIQYAFCCALLYKLGMFVAVFWVLVALIVLLNTKSNNQLTRENSFEFS